MIEKHIVLEDIDPVIFYGVNNTHLQMIKALFPKLRIVGRDNVIRVLGDEKQMCAFEENIETMRKHVLKFNSLKAEDIVNIVNGHKTQDEIPDGVIVYSVSGRAVKARSENQQKLIDCYSHNYMFFDVVPAGTGKTYVAIALAVRALKHREIKRIILTRPAVEAGERLGFLPGDLKDKLDPYLQPLYDALRDMIPAKKLNDFMEEGIVQIAPLAYMRGRTLDKACVILDEAQNTNLGQLKMFLTRMGCDAKFIVTGDASQIDLPDKRESGLMKVIDLVKEIKGVSCIFFKPEDIVRHPLVSKIVKAFDSADKSRTAEKGDPD